MDINIFTASNTESLKRNNLFEFLADGTLDFVILHIYQPTGDLILFTDFTMVMNSTLIIPGFLQVYFLVIM